MKIFKSLILIILFLSSCNQELKKPNIIFIYTDDQRFDTVGVIGNNQVYTPNLDKLAFNGAVFSNTYNMGAWHGAICVASRAMMISGKSVWRAKEEINYWKKNDSITLSNTWPMILKRNGYKTYMTGKWHIEAPVEKLFDVVKNKRPGMPDDNRHIFAKKLIEWKEESGDLTELENFTPPGYGRPIDEKDQSWSSYDTVFGGYWDGGKHWSEVLADDAIEFLKDANSQEDPFFMYLAFNAPHDPRQAPKKFIDLYPLSSINLPKNYSTQHPYMNEIGNRPGLRDEALAPYPRSEYAVKKHIQEYYAIISHLDEQVGKIIDQLENEKMLDNTYVIFTSDHGLAVGQHGLIGKQSLYDHSIRVPMIISGPEIEKGKKISHDIYLQDIVPTTLDLAGIEIPEKIDFKSFYSLIKGSKNKSLYDGIYGTFGCCQGNYIDYQRMIRKEGFKLMVFPKNKRMELYDLINDPYEMYNLANKLEYKEKVKNLFKDLTFLQKEVGDTLNLKRIFTLQ